MTNHDLRSTGFVRKVFVVVLIACIPPLVWLYRDLILLAVGAVLLAALLHLVAAPLRKLAGVPRGLALAAAGLFLTAIVVGAMWLFGSQIGSELSDVIARAKSSIAAIQDKLGHGALSQLFGPAGFQDISITAYLGSAARITLRTVEGLLVILVSGIYLAAEPDLYRRGLIRLFPLQHRATVDLALQDFARGLRLWLMGQLIQMFIVGLLSFLAVWLIGVHSPVALGVIAAVCEFVPYVGPILAGVPAVLVAFSQSTTLMIWTLVAYVIIHQVEGHLLTPLIQRRFVVIAPATMLLGIAAVEIFFGFFGILFAGPIVVLACSAVSSLWLRREAAPRADQTGEGAGAVPERDAR